MVFIEVDPSMLGTLADRLIASVAVAEEVRDRRPALEAHAGRAGDEKLGAAVRSFLDAWAYGCGLLAEDARQTAERLRRAGHLYMEVEDAIAEGLSHDA